MGGIGSFNRETLFVICMRYTGVQHSLGTSECMGRHIAAYYYQALASRSPKRSPTNCRLLCARVDLT
eukprot:426773-Prorocentrum_minimum.AAC.1